MPTDPAWFDVFEREFRDGQEADPGATVVRFPHGGAPSVDERANMALSLVSQAAAGLRAAEKRAEDTVAQAEDLASQAFERLRAAEARVQLAEKAQKDAEANLIQLAEALDKTREELEGARKRLFASESELADVKERAALAERRAFDAEAAIESITEAIRIELVGDGEKKSGAAVA